MREALNKWEAFVQAICIDASITVAACLPRINLIAQLSFIGKLDYIFHPYQKR
jgi:hypothetical protein